MKFRSFDSRPIFIVSPPRTGSTVFYQSFVKCTNAPYIDNLTNNHLSRFPLAGLLIQRIIPASVQTTSEFGKTRGLLQPSEASSLMKRWFGASIPSQDVVSISEKALLRMVGTLKASQRLFGGRPLIIKNGWNAYRIGWLANAIPGARFIWLRRDVREAACSDLAARYTTKGDPHAWTGVPPPNHRELLLLRPATQVVENQFQINNAISTALNEIGCNRSVRINFGEFMLTPHRILEDTARQFNLNFREVRLNLYTSSQNTTCISADEIAEIESYCEINRARLSACCLLGKPQ